MTINFQKYLPDLSDVMMLAGLIGIGVGISFEWSWPLALITDGVILLCLSLVAKLKGAA